MDESLDLEVKALLEKRRGDWAAIAAESGVSYSWLSKFMNGRINNPGFGTLKKLLAHLVEPTAARTGAVDATAQA